MKKYQGTGDEPDAYFYKVDIFQHKDRLAGWGIKKFPTFKVYSLGKEIAHLEGKDTFYNDLEIQINNALSEYAQDQELKME